VLAQSPEDDKRAIFTMTDYQIIWNRKSRGFGATPGALIRNAARADDLVNFPR
jgi:hypothetical protein